MSDDSGHPLLQLLDGFRASEPLGKQGRSFERLMAWWLLHDPEYKARYAKVTQPRRDVGVDLCAFPHGDGVPTAVQCKQHVGEIPKREIDSFLSAAATDEFVDGLLIHTGTGFSPNAEATIAAQRSPCAVVDLHRLMQSDVVWPASIEALDTGCGLPPREPWKHQKEALAAIRFALREGRSRTWIDMACGTGKTLVGSMAADVLAPDLAVVFVRETVLLHETVRAWRRDARVDFAELRICSRQDSDDGGSAEADRHRRVQTTTDVRAISEFLGRTDRRVVFCTYTSVDRLVSALATTSVTIDLIVADDAHHVPSQRGSATARSVLDRDRLQAHRRLFMTATPRVWDTDVLRLAEQSGAPLVDMRDSVNGDFGLRSYRLSHREAVRRGVVLPFEIHVVQVTTSEIDQVLASRRMVAGEEHSRAIAAPLAATQVAVVKAATDLNLRRIVAFHAGVDESKLFASSFAATAALTSEATRESTPQARHVDVYDSAHRRRAIAWFDQSEGACLLSNVKLLAEGVDSPRIDAIVWNHPRPPAGRVVQAVGRALRPGNGQTKAIIVIPMVVGPDGNVEKALLRSIFASTIRVLDALRSIDPCFTLTRESLRLYAAKRYDNPSSRLLDGGERTVAPLEITNAFADAIRHRLLPPKPSPRVLTTEAPRLRIVPPTAPASKATSHRPPHLRTSRTPFARGLNQLEAASGDHLLFGLEHPEGASWLRLVNERFVAGTLAHEDLDRIGRHLSFLAVGLGPMHSDLRTTLAFHSDRSVSMQAAAWAESKHSESPKLRSLSKIARHHDWSLDDRVQEMHSLLTHPGLAPVEQARLCLRPLISAATGLGDKEDPTSRLGGLVAALKRPWDPEPPRPEDGWRPDADGDAERADWRTYEAGWTAGGPWRAHARLIARHSFAPYGEEIRWVLERDARRVRAQRWDYTTWFVFFDELIHLGRDKRRAERTASHMRYRARAERVGGWHQRPILADAA